MPKTGATIGRGEKEHYPCHATKQERKRRRNDALSHFVLDNRQRMVSNPRGAVQTASTGIVN